MNASLGRRLVAEALGTAFLLAIVIGSGIMGERLAQGNTAIALLANAIATGCGLAVIIAMFQGVSGAQFNPVVTLSLALRRLMPWREVVPYVSVQLVAAIAGVVAAHWMFGEPAFCISAKVRVGPGQVFSEFVATFGLVLLLWAIVRQHLSAAGALIGAYIASAYGFTSSTSFANPAVTIARCLSDTFAGIRPDDVAGFIAAQLAGAVLATYAAEWLWHRPPARS